MAQDAFQIALEHHRAGRVLQAEMGYRAILEREPAHAEATHWLGVLLHQAGLSVQAVPLLERAVELQPGDLAVLHNLGQAYLAAGRVYDAVGVLQRARDEGLDTPALHLALGTASLQRGKVLEAIESLQRATTRGEHEASAWYLLGVAYRFGQQPKEARKALNRALEIDPGLANAWFTLGGVDADAGNYAQAAASYRKAIRARADFAAAYQALGKVLENDGKKDQARKAFETAMLVGREQSGMKAESSIAAMQQRLTGDERAQQLHLALAEVSNLAGPTRLPSDQVAALFDKYAGHFDEHLTGTLNYRVPEMIAQTVAELESPRPLDILDLGCGTGLCGPLLRPMAATLRGVDLSPAMIEKAKSRGVYDRLDVGDLLEALRPHYRAFDMLVAADVLNYVGDLAPVIELASAALREDGFLIFTVEVGEADRFEFHKQTHRYTHSEPYLRQVAQIYGLNVRSLRTITIRIEGGKDVPGYLVALSMPGD